MGEIIEEKKDPEGKLESWRFLWERGYVISPPLMSSGVVTSFSCLERGEVKQLWKQKRPYVQPF